MSFRLDLDNKAVDVLLSAAGLLLILAPSLELSVFGWPLRDGQSLFDPIKAQIAGVVLLGVGISRYRKRRAAFKQQEILNRAHAEVLQHGAAEQKQENPAIYERVESLRNSQVKAIPIEITDSVRSFARQALKPSVLLVNLGANTDGYLFFMEQFHASASRGSSVEEYRKTYEFAAARQQWIDSDPEIQEAIHRLRSIGLSVVARGDVTRVVGDLKAYGRLEELAADDAGITDPEARAQAAEKFRIYMLRNYSKDYLTNREKYPDVGGSPYFDPATWPKNN